MNRSKFAFLPLLTLILVCAGCADDEPVGPTGPFDLTFTGDASFQGAHGDQEVHVVVTDASGEVLASESGEVSASENPAFSFSFSGILEQGQTYSLRYWIDSNFGSGTPGVCDPPNVDHQWIIAIDAVNDDVQLADTHRPGETSSVCDSFTFDLSFGGDATFQGAHGGQTVTAAVVRTGTRVPGGAAVVATASTTVSASGDASFSFNFSGILSLGLDYEVHYWIDSNFGGGTVGVCDGPANDHQWRIDVGEAQDDVTLTDNHRPAETNSVCDSFVFDLSFSGDASFQGAHGGQNLQVAVVDEGSGLVVATGETAVSGSEDPTFSFDFPGLLVRERSYHLDYWIDSNFGGGSAGVCDPRANDHQWRLTFGPVSSDETVVDSHRPAETQDVCSTFN